MTATFLDTSALYDAADRTSSHHAACASELRSLLRSSDALVTTTLVLAELHALTLHRAGPGPALDAARRIAESARIELVDVTATLVDAAMSLLESRPDKAYSLTDATSFAIMRSRGIDTAFTLDADFRADGFLVVP